MKEIVEKIIQLKNKDNRDFLAEFPDKKPMFEYKQASDNEIQEFEREFNIKLPKHLIEYFKEFNPIKTNLMFVELLGLDTIRKNYEKFSGYSEALNHGLLPVADDNGDLICVNTMKEIERLLIYSHEENDFKEIRDTFEMFLTKLILKKEKHEKELE